LSFCLEYGVVLSHEDVSHQEHVLGDIHLHHGGGTHLLSLLHMGVVDAGVVGHCLQVVVTRWFVLFQLVNVDLTHHLRSERTQFLELHGCSSSLGHSDFLGREHPFVIGKNVVFSTDYECHVAELFSRVTGNNIVSRWHPISFECLHCKRRHTHKTGTRVEGDEAFLLFAHAHRLSFNLDIVQFDSKHVLEFDVIPVNITLEFLLIIITKRHV